MKQHNKTLEGEGFEHIACLSIKFINEKYNYHAKRLNAKSVHPIVLNNVSVRKLIEFFDYKGVFYGYMTLGRWYDAGVARLTDTPVCIVEAKGF